MTLPSRGLAEAVMAGDRRAAGRLLSRAEAGDPAIVADLQALYRAGGRAQVVGVTGPPGAGKSTLVDQLLTCLRAERRRVAVLAVDPSSPFSGGAVLGDRVRMSRHAADPDVLIRSMAARGRLGGLAPAAGDVLSILDAMGFDMILVETVGVGQNEVEILVHADSVVLLQTAHGGDAVQMVKAGVLEIADLYVVNKADAPGSDKMVAALLEMAAHAGRHDTWTAPVLRTEATSGTGIDALVAALAAHAAHRRQHPEIHLVRRRQQVRARVLALSEASLHRRLRGAGASLPDTDIDAVIARTSDPYALAARLAAIPPP